MKKLNSLEDLYLDLLKDTFNAEAQLTKALPKMAKAASSPELQQAFMTHLEETEQQIEKLEEVFGLLGIPAKGKKCVAMEGLIEEGKEIIAEEAEEPVKDAALIAAAQKVEHYEIAAYGCLVTWAKILGHDDQAELLGEILDQEKETDEKLTMIAESSINFEAAEADFGSNGHSMNGRSNGKSAKSGSNGRATGKAANSKSTGSRTRPS
jgi:ferritin-like metal-binding protein YciE